MMSRSGLPACPACGGEAGARFYVRTQEAGERRVCGAGRCRSCRTLFLEDYSADRAAIYGGDYAAWGRSSGADEAMVASAKREAFRRQIESLRPFVKDGGRRLLDVGTGNGYLLDVARELGFDCAGVELSAQAAAKASERFPGRVFAGTLEQAAYPDSSFDVIAMTDVIEHLGDPNGLMREVVRIAAPGALLFIITPDADAPSRVILGRDWFQYKYEHVVYYTPASLAALLGRHGFAVRSSRRNTKRFTLSYYQRYFTKYSLLGPLGKGIAAVCAALPPAVRERAFTNPVSGEMLVIAEKR